jgi:hypothetical protein
MLRRFIVVRKKMTQEIIQQEEIVLSEYPSLEEMAKTVAQKVMNYEKQYPYPEYEILSGTAETLQDFLESFP